MLLPRPRHEGGVVRIRVRGERHPRGWYAALPFIGFFGFFLALLAGWLESRWRIRIAFFGLLLGSWPAFLVLNYGDAWLGWFATWEARFDLRARTFELVERRTGRAARSGVLDPALVHETSVFVPRRGRRRGGTDWPALVYGRPKGPAWEGEVTEDYVFLVRGDRAAVGELRALLDGRGPAS